MAFNRLADNLNGILALFCGGVTIAFNQVASAVAGAGGIGVTGDDNLVAANYVDLRAALAPSLGIVMFGLESGGPGFVLGRAVGTVVAFNTVRGATLPIWEQTGTSGTTLIANRIDP